MNPISSVGYVSVRDPERSTRYPMAAIVALSCVIDASLLLELVSVISAGRPIRPVICAAFLAAGLPLMAEQFSRRVAGS